MGLEFQATHIESEVLQQLNAMKSQGIGCTDINAADHPRRLHYKEYTLST
jgi:hypothetical protein